MNKNLRLAILPILALGIGALVNAKQVKEAKATDPIPVIAVDTPYEYSFGRFADGSLTPVELHDAGLLWAREDVDLVVRTVNSGGQSMKVLDMTIVSDDGGGYARMLGIGSGGLEKLVAGRAYYISMYLNLSGVTNAASELDIEYTADGFWTGVGITNGVARALDGKNVRDILYDTESHWLSFTFLAREQAYEENPGVRPYIKFTMCSAENSDVVTVGDLKIAESATYVEFFENYAVGTTATDGLVNLMNVASGNMNYVKVDEDANHNHYLHIKHNNTSSANDWRAFYFNRMTDLISGHTYRLQVEFLSTDYNFIEMYVKYNDTGDGCYTFLPDGTFDDRSHPTSYLSNPFWDGQFLAQDILFTSAKNATWWQQVAIQFCIPANTELDVKIANYCLYDVTELGSTEIEVSGANSFVLGTEYSKTGLQVNYVRDEERVPARYYTVDSSAFNKDEIGEYQIGVSASDGVYQLSTTYTATVHNNNASIEMKSNPTKVEYRYNEELDLAGAKINLVKENGDKTEVDVTAEMVSGYNKQTLGEQTVTVTYLTFTTTFQVTVVDYITGITLKSAPTKVVYEQGDELALAGAVITVTKASGATEDVNVNATMVTGYNNAQLGEQTLTVTYQGFTATFTVTVNEKVTPQPEPQPEPEQPDQGGSGEQTPEPDVMPKPEKKGCKSSVIATSALISILSIAGVALLTLKKKEK